MVYDEWNTVLFWVRETLLFPLRKPYSVSLLVNGSVCVRSMRFLCVRRMTETETAKENWTLSLNITDKCISDYMPGM